jgi:hypothetical protein
MRQPHRTSFATRAVFVCALFSPVMLLAADVGAEPATTPIEITLLGPAAVRVRVALGTSFPCDSGDNRRIVEGKFPAGHVVHAQTPDRCVCFQRTYAPFSDTDWSASSMVCRPQICTFPGKKKCVPAPDPTIRLRIPSSRPN